MIGLIDWCYRKAPRDIQVIGTYAVINYVRDRILSDYLLRKSCFEESYLKSITIEELKNTDPNEQYITLLAHIFCNDIKNIPPKNMHTFIRWMLRDKELYETGLIAYIWDNSCFSSTQNYPTHSTILQIVEDGCDRETLEFLWNVAVSNDMYLCTVLSAIELSFGAKPIIKLISYLYVCSRLDINEIVNFVSDIVNEEAGEIHYLTDLATTYTWDANTIVTCINKGYTIGKLDKYLERYAETSFIEEGRKFPIKSIPSRVIRHSRKLRFPDIQAPRVPNDYTINYRVWNKCYLTKESVSEYKSKYVKWFENLNDSQIKTFASYNPIAYKACRDGNIQYVEKILDDIMTQI